MKAFTETPSIAPLMLVEMNILLGRMLMFPMPTIAVVSGHAYAGGLFFALAHDVRIKNADVGVLCMSEINIGLSLGPGFGKIIQHTCKP